MLFIIIFYFLLLFRYLSFYSSGTGFPLPTARFSAIKKKEFSPVCKQEYDGLSIARFFIIFVHKWTTVSIATFSSLFV